MRTYTMHKQKLLFRFKDSPYSDESIKQELIEAIEAVLDCYGDSDTIIMMQCRRALDRARRNQ